LFPSAFPLADVYPTINRTKPAGDVSQINQSIHTMAAQAPAQQQSIQTKLSDYQSDGELDYVIPRVHVGFTYVNDDAVMTTAYLAQLARELGELLSFLSLFLFLSPFPLVASLPYYHDFSIFHFY
jgi:hypothetical protein